MYDKYYENFHRFGYGVKYSIQGPTRTQTEEDLLNQLVKTEEHIMHLQNHTSVLEEQLRTARYTIDHYQQLEQILHAKIIELMQKIAQLTTWIPKQEDKDINTDLNLE
jgi:predicted  nucleic acid-binding Zn-ribbon protein